MEIEKYFEFVEQTVFPEGQRLLRECKSAQEIFKWKRDLCRQIHSQTVEGEIQQRQDPQEEEIKQESESDKVITEIKAANEEFRITQSTLQTEQEQVRKKLLEKQNTCLTELIEFQQLQKSCLEKQPKLIQVQNSYSTKGTQEYEKANAEMINSLYESQSYHLKLVGKQIEAVKTELEKQNSAFEQSFNERLTKCTNLRTQTENSILQSVKLFRAGLTKIKNVFEYKTREGPYLDHRYVKQSNFFYPETSQLSFSNHIVGFVQVTGQNSKGFNYILSNGQKSNLEFKTANANQYTEVFINPPNAIVRKVKIFAYYTNAEIDGIQFFDANGTLILQAGTVYNFKLFNEFTLAENERLVGIRSSLKSGSESPRQEDLRFIIGYMEKIV